MAPGIYEIGSPDVTTYGQMMHSYARIRGLRPANHCQVPLLTPVVVGPLGRPDRPRSTKYVSHSLIGSLANEVVVLDPPAPPRRSTSSP